MQMSARDLESTLLYQIGALQAIAMAEGASVTHVKPHGALHNVACADQNVATSIVKALRKLDPSMILLAPAHSILAKVAEDAGQAIRYEVFADRAYLDDGQLMPRSAGEQVRKLLLGAHLLEPHCNWLQRFERNAPMEYRTRPMCRRLTEEHRR